MNKSDWWTHNHFVLRFYHYYTLQFQPHQTTERTQHWLTRCMVLCDSKRIQSSSKSWTIGEHTNPLPCYLWRCMSATQRQQRFSLQTTALRFKCLCKVLGLWKLATDVNVHQWLLLPECGLSRWKDDYGERQTTLYTKVSTRKLLLKGFNRILAWTSVALSCLCHIQCPREAFQKECFEQFALFCSFFSFVLLQEIIEFSN